jgi:hypothetical protein
VKNLINIEPSGFRKGEYVGYYAGGSGVVRITRPGNPDAGYWIAVDVRAKKYIGCAETLTKLSVLLEKAR